MKKYFYMAVAAVAALSSCSSEDAIFENNKQNEEAIEFTAIIEEGTETRATLDGNTPKWESTDEVNINGIVYTVAPESDASKATLTKKNSSDADPTGTFKAIYPASYSSGTGSSIVYTLPATYTYEEGKFNMPMYAESTTDNLAFKNLCGVLAITVLPGQMSSVSSIEVSSDSRMNGAFTVTSEGELTFSSAASGEADKKVTITASSAVEIPAAGKTFYVPVPPATHNPLTITLSDGTNTTVMTTTQSGGVTVARKTLYPIAFADNSNPYLLPGDFSVSATKKVKFTKSNIYWSNTDSKYHFEAGPTEYPTSSTSTSTWTQAHIGHFQWNKDEAKSRDISVDLSAGLNSDELWCSESSKQTVDGVSDLYVLSIAEWNYLFKDRGEKKYKNGVTVNSVNNCLIIAPDNVEIDDTKTTYTLAELNAAGLVCLPPSGQRPSMGGSSLVDNAGYYWTASSATASVNPGTDACYFLFYPESPYPANVFKISSPTGTAPVSVRYAYFCLRLVK